LKSGKWTTNWLSHLCGAKTNRILYVS